MRPPRGGLFRVVKKPLTAENAEQTRVRREADPWFRFFSASSALSLRTRRLRAFYVVSQTRSIQVKIADRSAGVRGFFGFAQRFLKFLLKQVGGVLLRLDGLAENRVAPVVLLFHCAGGFLHVVEHFRLDGGDMGNDCLDIGIHFEHCAAARASQIEGSLLLLRWGHLRKCYLKTPVHSAGLQPYPQ